MKLFYDMPLAHTPTKALYLFEADVLIHPEDTLVSVAVGEGPEHHGDALARMLELDHYSDTKPKVSLYVTLPAMNDGDKVPVVINTAHGGKFEGEVEVTVLSADATSNRTLGSIKVI